MMAQLIFAVVAMPALSEAAFAQNSPPSRAEIKQVAACTAKARKAETNSEACIGQVAERCMEEPKMGSTHGQRDCAGRENAIWDKTLNRRYKRLAKALSAKGAIKLRNTQRIWLKWRKAKCEMPYVLFEGGSIAGPMASFCVMRATALRTIELGLSLEAFGIDPTK